jgi:hypothetical protein
MTDIKNKIIDPSVNIPPKDKILPTSQVEVPTVEFKQVLAALALHIKDFIRWIRGSQMWEDEKGYIGINAVGERIYFYLGGGLYARFQRHPSGTHDPWDYLQAEFFTGMGVYGGNFNMGSATEVYNKTHPLAGQLVPYDTYRARFAGRIKLFKSGNDQYIDASADDVRLHAKKKVGIWIGDYDPVTEIGGVEKFKFEATKFVAPALYAVDDTATEVKIYKVIGGTNVTIVYNDLKQTATISAAGGSSYVNLTVTHNLTTYNTTVSHSFKLPVGTNMYTP